MSGLILVCWIASFTVEAVSSFAFEYFATEDVAVDTILLKMLSSMFILKLDWTDSSELPFPSTTVLFVSELRYFSWLILEDVTVADGCVCVTAFCRVDWIRDLNISIVVLLELNFCSSFCSITFGAASKSVVDFFGDSDQSRGDSFR